MRIVILVLMISSSALLGMEAGGTDKQRVFPFDYSREEIIKMKEDGWDLMYDALKEILRPEFERVQMIRKDFFAKKEAAEEKNRKWLEEVHANDPKHKWVERTNKELEFYRTFYADTKKRQMLRRTSSEILPRHEWVERTLMKDDLNSYRAYYLNIEESKHADDLTKKK